MKPIRVIGLFRYGEQAASTRYRFSQFVEPLAEQGIEMVASPLLGNEYVHRLNRGERSSPFYLANVYRQQMSRLLRGNSYDCAILQFEAFPYLPFWLESVFMRMPFVYDFDDAFFLRYKSPWWRNWLYGRKMETLMAKAAVVRAGNPWLASYASEFNDNVTVAPTVVDTGKYPVAQHAEHRGFRIGWIGSPSTAPYLELLREPLSQLGKESDVTLVVVGGDMADIPGVAIERHPWEAATEMSLLTSFDMGVTPLPDENWSRGKCAFKLIQYMAGGLPVAGSRVGANVDVVDKASGFLCTTSEEWLSAFRQLRDDPGLRVRVGSAGRRRIEARYSLASQVDAMAEAIRKAAWKKDT